MVRGSQCVNSAILLIPKFNWCRVMSVIVDKETDVILETQPARFRRSSSAMKSSVPRTGRTWKTRTLVVLRLLGIDVDQLQASGDVKAGEHDGTAWGLVMLTLGDVNSARFGITQLCALVGPRSCC